MMIATIQMLWTEDLKIVNQRFPLLLNIDALLKTFQGILSISLMNAVPLYNSVYTKKKNGLCDDLKQAQSWNLRIFS